MSNIVMDMINGYLNTFNEYEVKDPDLQKDLEALKEKMLGFASDNQDPMTFYGKFTESGLQEEYTNLIGKIAMAALVQETQTPSSDADGDLVQDGGKDPLDISVEEFLDQYRIPYEEVKKAGGRENGEAAYEKLLAVAHRADNMLDAQIIMEEERLLWHIVKDDQLDILKASLGKMDPLQPAMNITLEKQIEVTDQAQGIEELDYLLEKMEYEKIQLIGHALTRMNLAIQVAFLLLAYNNSKHNVQMTGGEGRAGENALKVMVSARWALKEIFKLMARDFEMTFDDLLADEGLKIWLLNPKNIDDTGRTKKAMNPKNYEAYREIVYEDILTDKSIIEVLKRKTENPIWYEI